LLSVLFFERLARQTSTLFPYTTLFRSIIRDCVKVVPKVDEPSITDRIDDILTHKVWGFAIFFLVLLFIFQAIFSWAEYPMALIEGFFGWLDEIGHTYLAAGALTDLLLNGTLAGLGGVLVFIP